MNECDSEVNTLAERNVNDSADVAFDYATKTNGFERTQQSVLIACQAAPDVFAAFCNIPQPVDDDLLANMCDVSLQSNVPDSLFERMARGDITHPDQLTAIYESSLLPEARTVPWYSVRQGLRIDLGGAGELDYLGATLRNVTDCAAASDCACFLVAREGAAVVADADGFLRVALFVAEGEQEAGEVRGADDVAQSVRASARGRVRTALFSDALYFFANGAWHPAYRSAFAASGARYQCAHMWQTGARVFVAAMYSGEIDTQLGWKLDVFALADSDGNSADAYTVPVASYGEVAAAFRLGFVATTPDSSLLVFSTFASATDTKTLLVHSVDVAGGVVAPGNPAQYARWTIAAATPIVNPPASGVLLNTAALYFPADAPQPHTELALLCAFSQALLTARLSLEEGGGVSRLDSRITQQLVKLCQSLDQSRTLYVLNNLVVGQDGAIDAAPPPFSLVDGATLPYAFALSADGRDAWTLRDTHALLRLHNPPGDPSVWGGAWTSDFTLYDALGVRVDDFGTLALDRDVYNPGGAAATWYMGTTHIASELPFLGARPPLEMGRSLHGTFRFAVTTILNTVQDSLAPGQTLRAFPYALGELQRANERALAARAVQISLADNSALRMLSSTGADAEILWQTNTTDQIGSPDAVASASGSAFAAREGAALSSPNGLYLLYVAAGFRLRLVFNAFNSFRFWQWCSASDDRFAQAISAQRAFCWSALKEPATTTTPGADGASFVDFRCGCIGGKPLFELLVPEQSALPASTRAALEQNLPCFAEQCGGGGNAGDTTTNVQRYVTQRCGNRAFKICRSTTVVRGSEFKNVGFLRETECYIAEEQIRCATDEACGPMAVCNNGSCVAKCATDDNCEALFGNQSLACVDQRCQPALVKPPQPLTTATILAIVAAVALGVLIVIFVALLALRKRTPITR